MFFQGAYGNIIISDKAGHHIYVGAGMSLGVFGC